MGGYMAGGLQRVGCFHGGAWWGDAADPQWAIDDRLEVYRRNTPTQRGAGCMC